MGLGDGSVGEVLACKCRDLRAQSQNPCEKLGVKVCKRQLLGSRDWRVPGLTGRQSLLAMGSRLVRGRNKVDQVSSCQCIHTLTHMMHPCKYTRTHKGNGLLTKREGQKGCGLATVPLKSGT